MFRGSRTLLGAIVFGWLPERCWGPLAVVASLASLAGLVLFPTAFPIFSSIGAFGRRQGDPCRHAAVRLGYHTLG
jgi:hypothetical protein